MELQIGDRVGYSRDFLQSCGIYTGSVPFWKGEIVDILNWGKRQIAEVKWENADVDNSPSLVSVSNLAKVGSYRY